MDERACGLTPKKHSNPVHLTSHLVSWSETWNYKISHSVYLFSTVVSQCTTPHPNTRTHTPRTHFALLVFSHRETEREKDKRWVWPFDALFLIVKKKSRTDLSSLGLASYTSRELDKRVESEGSRERRGGLICSRRSSSKKFLFTLTNNFRAVSNNTFILLSSKPTGNKV